MTQIILALKHDYILMASDRRLTALNQNDGFGVTLTDDECKLVALCNHSAISYTGLAQLDGQPTHEWIASTLKKHLCVDGFIAANIIGHEASISLNKLRIGNTIKHCTFLVAGYQNTKEGDFFPYCIRVSNAYGKDGLYLNQADSQFTIIPYVLPNNEDLGIAVIGEPLHRSQMKRIERLLDKVKRHGNSAIATLRILKDEIIISSNTKKTVGKKILGLCLPKKSVELSKHTGHSLLFGSQPINAEVSTFTYFEEGYNDMIQYGPTLICGNNASTNTTFIKTENSQSISMKLL